MCRRQVPVAEPAGAERGDRTSGAAPEPRLRSRLWRIRFDPNLILVVLLALFPIGPLLQPGYFWDAHDARHSVYFLFELDRGIQDGVLFPRWQPDFTFGYGYPMFNIYGSFSSYLGEVFHLLGLGFADSVKMVFGLSLVLSGLAMYGYVRRVVSRRAGLVAAVAYMVIPYRLVDIYVRAALAEALAYVFIPLVLWAAWAAVERPRVASILGLACSFALLVFTHPLSALLLAAILVFYVGLLALVRVNREQPLREISRHSWLPLLGHLGYVLTPVAFGVMLGAGLSAFFLLPAMAESRFVRLDQWYGGRYAWGGDFVEFYQLFSPQWGFGYSKPGPDDGMSFQLGVVPLVLSLFGVGSLGWQRAARSSARPGRSEARGRPVSLIGFYAALLAGVVVLMLSVSAPVWQVLPLSRLVQFPWRLLALAVVAMAFLSGAILWSGRRAQRLPGPATLLVVGLLVLGSLPFMQATMSEREVSMAGLIKFQQSADEMTGSTIWVKTIPRWSSMADYYIAGLPVTSKINYSLLYEQPGVEGRTIELRTQQELIEYYAPQPALVTFDRFYYPGWRAYLLDAETGATLRELTISQRGELGLITVEVPAGIFRVLLRFEDTPVRKLGWAISLLCLALGVLLATGSWAVRRAAARRGDEAAE